MTNKPNDVRVSHELMPCPFCGGKAKVSSFPSAHNVWCENQPVKCGNRSMFTPDQWNLRAQPADQQGEPVAWVECSPAWLKSGGDCATASRMCVGRHGISHLHPAQAQPATAKVDERAEFDKWYAKYEEEREQNGWMPLDRSQAVQMFKAWEARAKLNTPQ